MIDSTVVDTLGAVAGAIWISAAIFYQLVRGCRVHPGIIGAMALVGVAILLGSASLATVAPGIAVIFGALANGIFCLLGVGAWIFLERRAELINHQCPADEFKHA